MIVTCGSCGTKYRYDESRFEGKPSKKIRCTKCQAVFDIANPTVSPAAGAAADAPAPAPPRADIPPPVAAGDTTYARRPPSATERTSEDTTQEFLAAPQPKEPSARGVNLRMPVGKKLALAAIAGPDVGRTFPIDKPRVVIGRGEADIHLADGEISRQHAAIEVEDDHVVLVDLGSTNGTFCGGRRIDTQDLENYTEFEVGGTTLMLIITAV